MPGPPLPYSYRGWVGISLKLLPCVGDLRVGYKGHIRDYLTLAHSSRYKGFHFSVQCMVDVSKNRIQFLLYIKFRQ